MTSELLPLFRLPQRPAIVNDQLVLACEDNLTFMKRLLDGQMKLIVTSPPYNLGKDYEARISLDAYIAAQERVIQECVRILDSRGIDLLAARKLR